MSPFRPLVGHGPRAARRRALAAAAVVSVVAALCLAAASGPGARATEVSTAPGVTTAAVGQDPEAATVSPDGTRVYVANDGDGTISVVSPQEAKATGIIRGASHYASTIAFAKDGKTAFVGNGAERSVSIVQVSTNRITATVPVDNNASALQLTPDGSRLLVGDGYGDDEVITLATRRATTAPASAGYPVATAFSVDGVSEFALTQIDDAGEFALQRVTVATGQVTGSVDIGTDSEYSADLALSANGLEAAVLDDGQISGGTVDFVDTRSMTIGHTWTFGSGYRVDAMGLSPNGATSAFGMEGGTTSQDVATLVATGTGAQSADVPIDAGPEQVAFSGDGRTADVLSRGDYLDTGSLTRIPVSTPSSSTLIGVQKTPTAIAETSNGSRVFVTNSDSASLTVASAAPTGWRPTVLRISGVDRYDGAIAIADHDSDGTVQDDNAIYIASGLNYWDALSVSNIAAWNGPLFLTPPNGLTAHLTAELKRHQPQNVYIVGDTSAVSTTVQNQLDALFPGAVQRIAGADRYATSVAVQSQRYRSGVGTIWIVDGANYPDALSVSAAARAENAPMVLVDGTASQLGDATKAYLQQLIADPTDGGSPHFLIAGGTPSVSTGIEDELKTMGAVTRIAGPDRYTTSQAVNAYAFPQAQRVYFAVGINYPDALTGSTLAGSRQGPLYLVPSTCVPGAVHSRLAASGAGSVTLFGGTPSLSAGVAELRPC